MSDVQAVMDAAGCGRAALFGTLGGGAMSGLFTASFPERTRALIFAKLEPTTGLLARLADSPDVALGRVEREWGYASWDSTRGRPVSSPTSRSPTRILGSSGRA
ncbi:MAG: alpha/beta hydrolase [Actinomycetota bacterium]|nr:alpha/beta hydrolase [Actinomycetota bacterium]